VRAPLLLVAGSLDDTSGYLNGVRKIFDYTTGCDRVLVTYEGMNHCLAQNPPPPHLSNVADYWHYADPVWDIRRVNNLNQHFLTAFFALHLHGDSSMEGYLHLEESIGHRLKFRAKTRTILDDDGRPTLVREPEEARHWKGFEQYACSGIIVERAVAGKAPARESVRADLKDEDIVPSCLPPLS